MFKLIPTDEKFFEMFERSAELFQKGTLLLKETALDNSKLKENAAKLERLEHDADSITHEVLVRLDKCFITPIDREDIHRLALILDDCMDTMEAAVDHMVLYRIETLPAPVLELANCLDAQAAQIVKADRVTRKALGDLFDGQTNPLDVIKWRDIYEMLEDASDKCEDVAGVVEGIVLKHA
jgi:uncharacterized protein